MAKNKKIIVHGTPIVFYESNKQDFISLTDIARYRDPELEFPPRTMVVHKGLREPFCFFLKYFD